MAWSQRKIEIELRRKLDEKFEHERAQADRYYGYYTSALNTLLHENLYDSIKTIQPGLSDHGEGHVMNVLDNAFSLLAKKTTLPNGKITECIDMDAMQLYFICVLILFHDVGNAIANRKKHHERPVIQEIYNHVRGLKSEFEDEQTLIPDVASKHSGHASDGSTDTIAELGVNLPYLFSEKIHTKKCAALLRFADELAEGPHRTSIFMNKYYNYKKYGENSRIYQRYAEITKINIDRENERIVIKYSFYIKMTKGKISQKERQSFIELFDFTIKRLLKLEAERKYCRYYCDWLSPYKKTSVTFNFFVDKNNGNRGCNRVQVFPDNEHLNELIFDDLTMPDDFSPNGFIKKNTDLQAENVFNHINDRI